MDIRIRKALGNETRVHILEELKDRDLTYTGLMKRLGMDTGKDRGKFTYHLNILRDSGLVRKEDEAYRITEKGEAALVSAQERAETPVHRSIKPLIGGILLMLGGLLDILPILPIPLTVTPATSVDAPVISSTTLPFYIVFIAIIFLLRILTMAGGFAAISRRFWTLAIMGGIVGIINFTLTLGTALALIGTIFIGTSRKEFE